MPFVNKKEITDDSISDLSFNLSEINLESNPRYSQTKQQMKTESMFKDLNQFPYELKKGLDTGPINLDPQCSIADWDASGTFLLAIQNFAYLVDPLNPAERRSVQVCSGTH